MLPEIPRITRPAEFNSASRDSPFASVLLIAFGVAVAAENAAPARRLAELEQSLLVNASLAPPTLGYWGADFPAVKRPSDSGIVNAARMLARDAAANRIYLIYHHEMPVKEALEVFLAWRKVCPADVEIVPTLVLRMYDEKQTPVFTAAELEGLCSFFKASLSARRVAIYDVYPKREQAAHVAVLVKHFPAGVLRVGLQPNEKIEPPIVGAVADTWSGFCHGLTNEDWRTPGFGASTLRQWVTARNSGAAAVAWDLIAVAWTDRSPSAASTRAMTMQTKTSRSRRIETVSPPPTF